MRKTTGNLMLLAMLFGTMLVIANVVTAKTITTGIPLFGGIIVPAAVVAYPITFLITDVVGEIWGPRESHLIVRFGFICQLAATLIIFIAGVLPPSDLAMQASYDSLLGLNLVFVIASMVAYLVSQSWDVFVFHRIRARFVKPGDGPSPKRWIWNNASTMTPQIFDTVIFIGIAFGLGMGWFFDPAMLPVLLGMMVGQYLIKLAIAAIDTPFFYLLTRKSGRQADAEEAAALASEPSPNAAS